MNLDTFEAKLSYLTGQLSDAIEAEAMRLARCGSIGLSDYDDDDYTPVKVCLTVALENQAHQYMPFSPSGKAAVKNLRNF